MGIGYGVYKAYRAYRAYRAFRAAAAAASVAKLASVMQVKNEQETIGKQVHEARSEGNVAPIGVGHPDAGVKGVHVGVSGIKGYKGKVEVGITVNPDGEWSLDGARTKDRNNPNLGKAIGVVEGWLATDRGQKELAKKARDTAESLKGRDDVVDGNIKDIEAVADKAENSLSDRGDGSNDNKGSKGK